MLTPLRGEGKHNFDIVNGATYFLPALSRIESALMYFLHYKQTLNRILHKIILDLKMAGSDY